MPHADNENEQLLATYRTQLSEAEKAIRRMNQTRQALASIVAGLEVLTGKATMQPTLADTVAQNFSRIAAGIGVGKPSSSSESWDVSQLVPAPVPPTIVGAAVRALRKLPHPREMGAADILRLIVESDGDSAPNYATLFNALKRGAMQEGGFIYKRGSVFGLREWQTARASGQR